MDLTICGHRGMFSATQRNREPHLEHPERKILRYVESKSNLTAELNATRKQSRFGTQQRLALAPFIVVCRSRTNACPAHRDRGRGRKWVSDWDREVVYRSS